MAPKVAVDILLLVVLLLPLVSSRRAEPLLSYTEGGQTPTISEIGLEENEKAGVATHVWKENLPPSEGNSLGQMDDQALPGRGSNFGGGVSTRNGLAIKKRRSKRNPTTVGKLFLSAGGAAFFGFIALSAVAIENTQHCGTPGCYNGYCFAYCGLDNNGGDWCYTSRNSYSQSFEYVKCQFSSECDGCWKCAGSCTLGS